MNLRRVLPPLGLLASLCTVVAHSYSQADSISVVLGEKLSLPSKVLNEDRVVWIHTPSTYADCAFACPVLYLLDGQWHFPHAVMTVEYLSRRLKIPPMIVVGIQNTNRRKDFEPIYTPTSDPGRPDNTPLEIGSDGFERFLREELIPYVDLHYRTMPLRILEGHSLGAMFATTVLQQTPELFNSFIVLSPAYYGENLTLVERLGRFLVDHPDLRKSIFVALGSEWDLIHQGVDSLISQLVDHAPPSLRWHLEHYPHEDHNSVPLLSTYEGLRFVFAHWPVDVTDTAQVATFEMLKQHYASLSEEFGCEFVPDENVVESLGYELLYGRNNVEGALAVFKENVRSHPTCFSAYQGLGESYMIKGEKDLAIQNLRKSIELNPQNERAQELLDRLEYEEE